MDGDITVKIKAICSVPRLGFQDHFGSMHDTLLKFQIPLGWYTGAYWDKCIEKALSDTVDQVDYILCLDYDTLATPQHLRRMLETMVGNPHIDALASNQPRRGTGLPLWTIRGISGEIRLESTGPIKVSTAHFGFTMIRAAALKSLSRPWFDRKIGADGTLGGEGAIDPDIAFWLKWADEGKSLYVDSSVCVGHIEAMVSYFKHVVNPAGECELVQAYMSCSEWRTLYGGRGSMASLGEEETR